MSYILRKNHLKAVKKLQETISKLQSELSGKERRTAYLDERIKELEAKVREHESARWRDTGAVAETERMASRALTRIHQELHAVKGRESNHIALQRVVGNVQGIAALALDCQARGAFIPALDLYPEETEAKNRVQDQIHRRMTMKVSGDRPCYLD